MDNNYPASQTENEKANIEGNLNELVFKYLKYWNWFLFSVLLFLGISYVYINSQIPQYKIETDILIKDDKNSLGDEKDLLKQLDLNSSNKIIDNEVEILKSNTLMEKVVSSLQLQNNYYMYNHITKKILYDSTMYKVELLKSNENSYIKEWDVTLLNNHQAIFNSKKVPVNLPFESEAGLVLITANDKSSAVGHKIFVEFSTIKRVAQHYINNLNIEPASKDATVLLITMEDGVVQRGKNILNKLIDEYNNAAIDDKNKTTSNQLIFIQGRLDSLAGELNNVEKNVANYKSSHKITDLSDESKIFLQSVSDNDAQLTKLDLEQNNINNLENYLNDASDSQVNLPSMLGIDDPTLLGLVQQLAESKIKKESLLRTIPETNPMETKCARTAPARSGRCYLR